MPRVNTKSDSYEALCWDVITNVHRYIPKPRDRVLDLGAHFGVFSLYCAARGCYVKAVEPNPEVLVELVHSAAVANDIGNGKIEIVNAAVADKYRKGFLWHFPETSAINTIMGRSGSDGCIEVQCFSLADLLGESYWDCVKVDIEGAEYETFMAASEATLERIGYLTMEIHTDLIPQGQCQELVKKLEQNFDSTSKLYLKWNGEQTDIVTAIYCWR